MPNPFEIENGDTTIDLWKPAHHGHELPEGDRPCDHHAPADPEDGERAETHEELDAGIEDAGEADEPAVPADVLLVSLREVRFLVRLLDVGPDHPGPSRTR